ncbi:DUF1330 domain-containing protein [Pacificoceanicola onchidii]|uniref:DUF1330 domain-containing protein n=1 Tax=Pacificoceanicola onchidii TaxID=2562685 RepID=UPI0010A5B7DE|nr:DUF1330 domain-containing protein [Pacificoceanicola onchidii]
MPCYSILAITSTTQDWMAAYIPTATRLVAEHGGRYLARTTSHEQIEGPDQPARTRVLIEWPSRDAALRFMNDPAYVPHLSARTKGSESVHFLVDGIDDLA